MQSPPQTCWIGKSLRHRSKRDKLIIDPGVHTIGSGQTGPVIMKGDVFRDIEKGTLPGELRFEGFTPKDPSKEVDVTYKAARDIELGQLRLDSKDRLLFVPAPGKGECVTTPKVVLSNPSETMSPPNGPEDGKNPLTNQFAYFNIPGWWDDTCCDRRHRHAEGRNCTEHARQREISDGRRNAESACRSLDRYRATEVCTSHVSCGLYPGSRLRGFS